MHGGMESRRQAITQPGARRTEHFDVRGTEANFLVQLTIQGLLERLALLDASLRELPPPAAVASTQQQLAVIAHQDDADIGAKSLGIDAVRHGANILP
jgi:hypothetical protein